MKCFNIDVQRSVHHANSLYLILAYQKWLWATFLIFQFLTSSIKAQNCLDCLDSSFEAPLIVTLDEACGVNLEAVDFISDNTTCNGGKQLTLKTIGGITLGVNENSLYFEGNDWKETVLELIVESLTDESSCSVFIKLEDDTTPELKCENRRIFCGTDTTAAEIGYPEIIDNCSTISELSYEDDVVGEGCIGNFSLIFDRSWSLIADNGQTATCTQTISVQRPDITEVAFPADQKLDCLDSDISPDVLGYPLLFGERIDFGNYCNVVVGHEDDTTIVCGGGGMEVLRQWMITDKCTNFIVTHIQVIRVVDETAPDFDLPEELYYTTDPGRCFATINLPVPEIFDNCDEEAIMTVETTYGENGFFTHMFVPQGLHLVHYTAVDKCGNSVRKSVRMKVEDRETPTAIADEYTAVAIPSGGYARIAANTFDSGSYDNCYGNVYFKVRRMDVGGCEGANGDDNSAEDGIQEWYDDYAIFCCAEVGEEVQVIMRVYDIDPGEGPVDSAREAPGGDLHGHFTDAMIFIEIQDVVPPIIGQLPSYTIDCEDDTQNLERFGTPDVRDVCGYELAYTENHNLNDCGLGVIERIFTAIDPFGNKSTSIQSIYVENKTPFNESLISWPPHLSTNQCLSNLSPQFLRAPFNKPVILASGCAEISTTYDDQVYSLEQGESCYRIVRRWTVRDLCVFDSNQPKGDGVFEYIQIIDIIDNTPPDLIIPKDTIVSLEDDCDMVEVNLPDAYLLDCFKDASISSNSRYAYNPGKNASGMYPVGTTEVEFSAIDLCGNLTRKTMLITVEDLKAPQVACKVGGKTDIRIVDGETGVWVEAIDMYSQSQDNCTASELLHFTIRKLDQEATEVPDATAVFFDCDELGRQAIEVWSIDQNGNAGRCVTYLEVTDQNEQCPNNTSGEQNEEEEPTKALIAGTILTEEGNFVEDVNIQIKGDPTIEITTGSDGLYTFEEGRLGNSYVISPYKNSDIMNGLSTLDLLVMAKHISGVQNLESPYSWLAADVDGNGNISTLDLIRLRKVILNLDDAFPNSQSNWKFVKADFKFSGSKTPLSQEIPSTHIESELQSDLIANFIAVKLGDVNTSAQVNSFMITDRSDLKKVLDVHYEVNANEAFIEVPIFMKAEEAISGCQFSLSFDPNMIDFDDIEINELKGLSKEHFGLKAIDDGLISMSWFNLNAQEFNGENVMFTLKFRAKGAYQDVDLLDFSQRLLQTEAYTASGVTGTIDLRHKRTKTDLGKEEGPRLYQNRPNPFTNTTTILFELSKMDKVELTIYDLSGKILYTQQADYSPGLHEIEIERNLLGARGMYIYQLRTSNFTDTKRMILN